MFERRAYIRRARQWIENRGLRGFMRMLAHRLEYKLRREPLPGRVLPEPGPHPFDLAYRVETTGLIYGEALFDGHGGRTHSEDAHYWVTGYYGVMPSAFCAALRRMELPWEEFTFVDIGCGKGRAMLLALEHPFREVIGVELAPTLAAIAERNLQGFRAEWKSPQVAARVAIGDATRLALPCGPLLLFLYHPFARPVMLRFIAHIRAALKTEPREIYLLYANPELAPDLLATPGFEQMWREAFLFDAEDVAADRFGSIDEQFAAFRLRPSAR